MSKKSLKYLVESFEALDSFIKKILKEERSIEKTTITKKGFLIKKYSINYSKIDLKKLENISKELEKIIAFEINLYDTINKNKELLKTVKESYETHKGKTLPTELLEVKLKEALNHTNLMKTRIEQLKVMLNEGILLHKSNLGEDTEIFFASITNIANKILEFTSFSKQLIKIVLEYDPKQAEYYGRPRSYGRAMGKDEFKKTIKSKKLFSRGERTPVFDAPPNTIKKIKKMSEDELKNHFNAIGVVGAIKVVFFKTTLKPINAERPIPQSNGEREYIFPKGTDIEIIKEVA
tara:strand:- start:4341 stop:5216 length:876 start_codon:yes stop_codon:yes gene_type:complete